MDKQAYQRGFFWIAILLFIASFFLPAISSGDDKTIYGFHGASLACEILLDGDDFMEILYGFFLNLANLCALSAIILFFTKPSKWQISLLFMGLSSASYWALDNQFLKSPLEVLAIGYWLWLFSQVMLYVLLIMKAFHRKK